MAWWQVWQQQESVSFRYKREYVSKLGYVHRPMAQVSFWSRTEQHWQSIQMIIDTGADYTLLPRYMAAYIGLDYEQGERVKTVGLGGSQDVWLMNGVEAKVGEMKRSIPIGVVAGRVPPLMGRQDFFETFEVLFKPDRSITFRGRHL